MTTSYTLTVNGETRELTGAPKYKKHAAIERAVEVRKAERADVAVFTNKGTEVFSAAAPKKIKMSKPFTRVVELDNEFEVPEGYRVAYDRGRKGIAILHNFQDEDGPYALYDYLNGVFLLKGLPTTRSSGQAVKGFAPRERVAADA